MKCVVCDSDIDNANKCVDGYFGMIHTAICTWCFSSLSDLIINYHGFNDIETLKVIINELEEESND